MKVAQKYRTHQLVDAENLACAKAIAEKLRKNPLLLEDAKKFLREVELMEGPLNVRSYAAQWKHILEKESLDRIIQILISPDEKATALRQDSPFVGVKFLTKQEVARIYERIRHDFYQNEEVSV